jgi:hypothetical protein
MQGQQREKLKKVDIRILTKLHTMLNRLDLMEYKRDLIDTYAFRGRYVFSSKNLYEKEAEAIIKYLRTLQSEDRTDRNEIISDIMCRKIFSCFQAMGWKDAQRRLDLGKVYTWINEHGYLKKHLKKYTVEELPQLAEQVQNLRDAYLQSINR